MRWKTYPVKQAMSLDLKQKHPAKVWWSRALDFKFQMLRKLHLLKNKQTPEAKAEKMQIEEALANLYPES